MKLIPLTRGQFAKVDDEDYESLSKFKWHARYDKTTKSYYAGRTGYCGKRKYKTILMHRSINCAKQGELVDHKDHDTLNNQRSNLRTCTNSQNCANSRKLKITKNKYKGVTRVAEDVNKTNPYLASLKHEGKIIYLGYYKTEVEAMEAYNDAAIKHHGEFAHLNKVEAL